MKINNFIYLGKAVLMAIFVILIAMSCGDDVEPNANGKGDGKEEEESTDYDEFPPITIDDPNVKRLMWASINGTDNAVVGEYNKAQNNKVLINWRMFTSDKATTGFDLYKTVGTDAEVKVNSEPIVNSTSFQDADIDGSADIRYRLCYAGSDQTLDTHTITAAQLAAKTPYISIPLASTSDIDSRLVYEANDVSVGDLDGDGVYEIILKRIVKSETPEEEDEGGSSVTGALHTTLLEAYKLNGVLLWRVCLGPNIIKGNGSSFAVDDFDGDGRCEIAMRTAEGTIFGDGVAIEDTNGDGKTDYRVSGQNYINGGPEFLSIIDGMTGRERARTDYIALGTSEEWGDSYYKRSSSYRIGAGNFSGQFSSILMCRGVYGKMVLEAWDYRNGEFKRRWRFNTENKGNESYRSQGCHSLSIGDVDGDGLDEVVYGSCTIDNNGKGLNSSGLGHGDALHLGKFDPSRNGLQIWSCFETGSVGAALRDAKTGKPLWKFNSSGDVGRALVADIDPEHPGCEMWWAGGNAHSSKGVDLGYKPSSCNMAIWWSGSLNRQLINSNTIDAQRSVGNNRVFTIYRYEVVTINGSKSNPCFYGDILGDWREEIIQVKSDNSELRLFSTWYPTEYKFPYLMSDQVYRMSAINQNIGYNQPTQLGYYLGSDLVEKQDE